MKANYSDSDSDARFPEDVGFRDVDDEFDDEDESDDEWDSIEDDGVDNFEK
jgi:hypothetical protein